MNFHRIFQIFRVFIAAGPKFAVWTGERWPGPGADNLSPAGPEIFLNLAGSAGEFGSAPVSLVQPAGFNSSPVEPAGVV